MKPKVNIMIIGDGEVGKTSILKWYDKRKFNQAHIRTSGLDQVQVTRTIDGNEFRVVFWDTAGQEKFRNLTYQYYKNADGIIIAFDLTKNESFLNTRQWLLSIYKNAQKDKLIKTLCGNKSDLLEVTNDYVQDEAAEKIASEHQMKYFKTSAYKGDGIDEMMEHVINQVYEKKLKAEFEAAKLSDAKQS